MATGNFEDTIELSDGTEIEIHVEWEGYYEPARGMGGPWEDSSPAEGDMEITKAEPIGEWPEGLSKEEFDAVLEAAEERLIEKAWDEYHDQSEGDF